MNTIGKIKKSWWVLLSFLLFLNGFGFIYIGLKHNNKNWLFEGIIYEIPWFFYFIVYAIFGLPKGVFNPTSKVILLAFFLMLVSIVRSFWVAIKLADTYVDGEKPIPQTRNPTNAGGNDGNISNKSGCCLCILVIFIIFALVSIL